MNMKKIAGILILCLSLLTVALVIMLAQISLHVDKIDGVFRDDIRKQIPFAVYPLIVLPIIAGLCLIFSDNRMAR